MNNAAKKTTARSIDTEWKEDFSQTEYVQLTVRVDKSLHEEIIAVHAFMEAELGRKISLNSFLTSAVRRYNKDVLGQK